MKILAWRGWAALREDTGELLSASPDVYEAKHAAMNYEHEHEVACTYVPVRIVRREAEDGI